MTHQVALSEEAYLRLKRERRRNESFSKSILRLLDDNQASKRNPHLFSKRQHVFTLTRDEHERESLEGRAGEDAWDARS